MIRRILDMTGGLVIGLAVAAGIHCGTDGSNSGGASDGSFVDSASAADSGGGGDEGVPAWAAHEGYGACSATRTAAGESEVFSRTYDSHGRLIRIETTSSGSWQFSYDEQGRITTERYTPASGVDIVTSYSWDC